MRAGWRGVTPKGDPPPFVPSAESSSFLIESPCAPCQPVRVFSHQQVPRINRQEAAMSKTIIPCDDRCMFAKGDDCDCECEGKNHKQGHRLTEAQRTIIRTKAGRRVQPLQPRTDDYRLGREMYRMHEEGFTKREVAAHFAVSAPTVRRYITRYLLAVEVYYHAKKSSKAA